MIQGQTPVRVLYLSYNGLLDPLGQSQVLQYLVGLSKLGHDITLITFEKPDEWSKEHHRQSTQQATLSAGIRWIPLGYHRAPKWPATLYDLTAGFVAALYQVVRRRIQIVHVRGYVLGPIAAMLSALPGVRLIFDQRSLWPDELVEIGTWRSGSIGHQLAKGLERWLITGADAVVCLTRSAQSVLQSYPYMRDRSQRFSVITTCTNLDLFHPAQQPAPRPFVLGYLGTVGIPYLLDEVFAALNVARSIQPETTLLVVNRRDHRYIAERAAANNVPDSALEVRSSDHREIVEQLWRMSAGIVFITPTPCRRACAPTKVGELLASGVPCLANAGVGDLEQILEGEGVGVIVPDFSAESLEKGMRKLFELCREPDIRERCAAAARRHFALEDGIQAYDALYAQVVTQS